MIRPARDRRRGTYLGNDCTICTLHLTCASGRAASSSTFTVFAAASHRHVDVVGADPVTQVGLALRGIPDLVTEFGV